MELRFNGNGVSGWQDEASWRWMDGGDGRSVNGLKAAELYTLRLRSFTTFLC